MPIPPPQMYSCQYGSRYSSRASIEGGSTWTSQSIAPCAIALTCAPSFPDRSYRVVRALPRDPRAARSGLEAVEAAGVLSHDLLAQLALDRDRECTSRR